MNRRGVWLHAPVALMPAVDSRRQLHTLFGLGTGFPCFRKVQELNYVNPCPPVGVAKKLVNVHEGLPPSGCGPGARRGGG